MDKLQKTFVSIVMLTLIVILTGWSAGPARAAQCTAEKGQLFIDQGRYKDAVREFTCLIEAQPTEVEGYRGRIEAELLLGRYSDALRDYTRVTAFVLPVHPDARNIILDGYAARLSAAPDNVPALTGASFARWYFFDYAGALQVLNQLLSVQPDNLYGNLFRGSTRVLMSGFPPQGTADLDYALALAPQSPDVHYIVADAYLYGRSDYTRAFDEAMLALNGGLDTPRVHAILAAAYLAFGDPSSGASHIKRHIDLVTTGLLPAAPLAANTSVSLDLVPGRTYKIPIPAVAGETISLQTGSHDFTDTIIVLLAPDGTPVVGSDDERRYFAGLQLPAPATGTYQLLATSFEAISTGALQITRK